MRKILGFILLVATFLGGYHLGRQKDSPDLIGYTKQAGVAIAEAATNIYNSMSNGQAPGGDNNAQADARAAAPQDGRDTRAYVNDYYAEQDPRADAPAAQPAPAAAPAVAQTDTRQQVDLAGKIWRALNPPKPSDGAK